MASAARAARSARLRSAGTLPVCGQTGPTSELPELEQVDPKNISLAGDLALIGLVAGFALSGKIMVSPHIDRCAKEATASLRVSRREVVR
jgi:hypothetical protein